MATYGAKKWIEHILLNDPNMLSESTTDIVSQHSIIQYVADQLGQAAGLNEAAVQNLIDTALASYTLDSTKITDFETAVEFVINTFGAITQTELTTQLSTNLSNANSYTDQEINDLFYTADNGHPEWLQDVRIMDNLSTVMMKVKSGDIKEPKFEKITDDGNGSDGIYGWLYEKNKESEAFFSWFVNCRWKKDSAVYPVVRWCPVADGLIDEKVAWGMEYYVRGFGGTLSTSSIVTIKLHQPIEPLEMRKMYVSIFAPIDMTNSSFGMNPEIVGRVFRDSDDKYRTDTFPNDVFLLSFGFVLQVDKPGAGYLELPFYYIAE